MCLGNQSLTWSGKSKDKCHYLTAMSMTMSLCHDAMVTLHRNIISIHSVLLLVLPEIHANYFIPIILDKTPASNSGRVGLHYDLCGISPAGKH